MSSSFSKGELKALLELTDIIHSISDRAALLNGVLQRLQKVIPFSSAVFLPKNAQTGHFQFQGKFLFNTHVRGFLLWTLYYAPLDPLSKEDWISSTVSQVRRYTDFVPISYLEDSEWGRDFMPAIPLFYCMAMTLGWQGDSVGAIGLHRIKQDGDFSAREVRFALALAPRLSWALYNINLIETLSSSTGMGMITIGPDGSPSYINDEAKQLLHGRAIGEIPDPDIHSGPVFFRSGARICRVRAVRGKWKEKTILLEALPTSQDLISKLSPFDLTPRQQEIAMMAIQGFSNQGIADRLSLSLQTVKDHFRAVFMKAEVNSRGELSAKVFGVEAVKDS